MQRMAHPDGECASVKAAEKAGTVFILSTISTTRYYNSNILILKICVIFQKYVDF